MCPTLPKSYKGAYPFKLGTTSFIYPDHIIPNIKLLGPYLDEIELLFFESQPANMPSRQEIKKIRQLAQEFDLTYNIHLYGAASRHDHLSLDKLSPVNTDIILPILKQFKKVVSLEVFPYERLVSSLNFLEKCWQKYDKNKNC